MFVYHISIHHLVYRAINQLIDLPNSMRTLEKEFRRITKEAFGIGYSTKRVKAENAYLDVPIFSPIHVIMFWLIPEDTREFLINCSNLLETNLLKDPGIRDECWTGSMWHSILDASKEYWIGNYRKAKSMKIPILFFHILLYNDEYGFTGCGKTTQKQTILTISCGEWSKNIRSDYEGFFNFPIALIPFGVGLNNILTHFTEDFLSLRNGVVVSVQEFQYLIIAPLYGTYLLRIEYFLRLF